MKIASVADVKSRFSAFLKESEKGPVIVTKNGRPVAVLLSVDNDDDLERLVLAYSPKFQAILRAAQNDLAERGGVPHEAFWHEVEVAPETIPDFQKED